MFVLNQHRFTSGCTVQADMQQHLISTLKLNIEQPGRVLVCLHPWQQPVTLTRAWCLYELYVSLCCQCEVTMCFSAEGAAGFYRALESDPEFSVSGFLGVIDAENAEATEIADKDMILADIKQTIGTRRFNLAVQGLVEKTLRAVATSFLLYRHGGSSSKRKLQTLSVSKLVAELAESEGGL